jgi:two-component system sensor histidine kinase AtoS
MDAAETSTAPASADSAALAAIPPREVFDALMQENDRMLAEYQRIQSGLLNTVRQLSEDLEHKNRLLARQERLAALGEMAAGVAHEIRNPLGGISLYIELLSKDVAGNAAALAICGKMSAAVARLNHTVEQILGFTRTLEPRIARIETRWLVDEVVSIAQPVLDAAGARVHVEIARDGTELWGDQELLHQVLLNLIRNAAEASPKDGTVTISATAVGDGMLALAVRDHGRGFDEETRSKLFTPFFTKKKGGTGLGLALSQRIVEAHRGSMSAANHAHGGAIFTLTLPSRAGA